MANLRVADVEAAKGYTDYLRLSTEEFNIWWPLHLSGTGVNVQLVTRGAAAGRLGHFRPHR
jgi:hypothetical protein